MILMSWCIINFSNCPYATTSFLKQKHVHSSNVLYLLFIKKYYNSWVTYLHRSAVISFLLQEDPVVRGKNDEIYGKTQPIKAACSWSPHWRLAPSTNAWTCPPFMPPSPSEAKQQFPEWEDKLFLSYITTRRVQRSFVSIPDGKVN